MDDDELRARLRAADPARRAAPADSWIEDLAEATMDKDSSETTPARTTRPWLLAGAAAAVVAAVAGGAFALGGDDGDGDKDAEPRKELALALPAADPMRMCVQFSTEALAPMELAFSGEAYDVDGTTVRLTPDHWYRGGDGANDITLNAGSPDVLLEGGIVFEEGRRYLVTATDGTVNTCGFSGEYTDEMAAAYDEAFGG